MAAAFLAGVMLLGVAGLGYASSNGAASAAQYQYSVAICHHTKGKGATHHVTIRASVRAWPAHQRHGDTMGACSTQQNTQAHSAKSHTKKFHPKSTLKSERASKAKDKGKEKGKEKGKGKGKP